ncbi:MAG: SusC/RagA family TonB-linked outer membrane protein [Thalassobius sp.]|nr:SusC/RagA family TonB-linked outer membrane protein [Thalassovita sp.]
MKRILTIMLILSATLAFGQQQIKGVVTAEEDGLPLPGVSILIKGTTTGTTTDLDGNFSLQASQGDVLSFSYIGYVTREVPVEGQTNFNIALETDLDQLEEVVVIGYGEQKKVNLTGAVETIGSKELVKQPVFQTSQALVGLSPGLTAIQSSGQPGGDQATLRIRGVGSLEASNDPLILIDGVAGDINGIDPNDIESISVLKDAAAAAIYGSRASNGVILVTTRRGKSGDFTVNYNNYLGIQKIADVPDYVGALDFLRITNTDQAVIDNYAANMASNPDLYPDTDWLDLLFSENGFQQYHNVSVTGGTEKSRVLASLSYTDQGANVVNYTFKRYNGRFNSDFKFTDKVDMNFDVNFRKELTAEPSAGLSEIFRQAYRIDPTQVAIHSDGSWGDGWGGQNPIAAAHDGGQNKTEDNYFRGLFKVNYRPVKGLTLSMMYSPEYRDQFRKNFLKSYTTYIDWDAKTTRVYPNRNRLGEANLRWFEDNFNAIASYTKTLADHDFSVLGGYEFIKTKYTSFGASRYDFIMQQYQELDAGSAESALNNGSSTHSGLSSVFGRFSYAFKGKYLFEANVRRDASSRFAPENRVSVFPSFSAGWRISDETFFSGVSFMNNLKLRASWGQLGNQQIGSDFPYASTIALGGSNFIFDGVMSTGATQNVLANRNIKWEVTETSNIGIDAGFFSNKLTFSADYYIRNTKDILLELPIPAVVGLQPSIQNAGSMENKGWDLTLGWQETRGEFSYSVKLNASDVQNKVTDLAGVGPIISDNSIIEVGSPMGSIYGYETQGLFQSEDEINEAPAQFGSLQPGNIRYRDQLTVDTDGDGIADAADGVINADDRVILGNPFPRLTYALNLSAEYKGFDLSIAFQGVGKRDVFLQGDVAWALFNAGKVQKWHVEETWTPERTDAKYPVLIATSAGSNDARASSTWIFNAAYLSLRNVTLGYTLPQPVLDNIHLRNLRVFFAGQNLFNFNKLPDGMNPLTPNGSSGAMYPIVTSYTMGVNATF